ncbi:MAG: hypothetical protein WC506_05370 [Candidatus Micrarchaeia archaeon]
MIEILEGIYGSRKFTSKELTLGVLPESFVLHLAGYIEFFGKSPSHGHEKRFFGHESAELKNAIRELFPQLTNMAILVSTSPCAKPGKETLYHFQITQNFGSAAEMEAEIEGLKSKGFMSKHTYEVRKPKA